MVAEGTVRLLGDERKIATAGDWQHAHPARLWLYNLHYFDDLNSSAAANRDAWQRSFIQRWIRDNPPVQGVGWEPYPISLRVVSWIRWLLRGNDPVPGMLDSLAIQVRHLRRRLEHHLLGNHLFVNAKTLLFAGAFFTGAEADAWVSEGHRLMARELDEQILADGGHFERSPMYHALLLEDVLDLLALDRSFPGAITLAPELRRRALPMLKWLEAMTHPDGQISLFNDATHGVAALPAQLVAYAGALGIIPPASSDSVIDLPESGYTRVERGDAVLLVDTGELGPDYLPGHGHADTLSFELSVAGSRVVVDSGVSEYGTSAERERQRGTAAHNTVVVDGQDSSEVWHGFRVARRARVHDRRVSVSRQQVTIHAEHDGYHRLDGRVTHARSFIFGERELLIEDRVRGRGRHEVQIYLHFAPEFRPVPLDTTTWALGPRIRVETGAQVAWSLVAGTVHHAMGVRSPGWVLMGRIEAALPIHARARIYWS